MSVAKLSYTPPKQVCSCCGAAKPLSEFYRQAYTGIPSSQCKTCTNVKRSVERHKAKHGKFVSKEKIREMGPIDYTLDDWRAAMLHFGGECAYCGTKEGRARCDKHDREHFVPLSRGGHAVRENIGPACTTCNRGRGNRALFPWFRSKSFWTAEREQRIVAWIGLEAAKGEGYYDE